MDVDKIKLQIIKAGEKAVKQLIKVAEERTLGRFRIFQDTTSLIFSLN
jgi:hypothetical protein